MSFVDFFNRRKGDIRIIVTHTRYLSMIVRKLYFNNLITMTKTFIRFFASAFLYIHTVKAQTFYTDLNPDVVVNSSDSVYMIDLNQDGVSDYKIVCRTHDSTEANCGTLTSTYTYIWPLNGNQILSNFLDVPLPSVTQVRPVGLTTWSATFPQNLYSYEISCGYLMRAQTRIYKPYYSSSGAFYYIDSGFRKHSGYLHVKFHFDGNDCEGWIQMRRSYTDFFVKDYSYTITHKKNEVIVFPNPAQNLIKITTPSNLLLSNFQISDAKGRRVIKGVIDQEYTNVDLSGLSRGLYFIQVGDNPNQTVRVIKE